MDLVPHKIGQHWGFTKWSGKPIPRFNDKAWSRGLRKEGIEKIRCHGLRHTWASWLAQEGVPLHVIQALGGLSLLRHGAEIRASVSGRIYPPAQMVDLKLRGTNSAQPEGCHKEKALEAA